MRSIAIIGAGQSGLQLAFGLLRDGYDVTLFSDRTADQILNSRLPSTNAMFSRALDRERALGIHFWDGEDPIIDYTFVRVAGPDGKVAVSFDGRFTRYGQSVDQRLKFSTWLQAFEQRGGNVRYGAVDLDALDGIAARHDLTIVSAGKGDISRRFELDQAKMTFGKPQRSIGMCALIGADHFSPDGVYYNVIPGTGEVFGIPMLTAAGPATAWIMEAIPGGPMDRWAQATGPDEMLALTQQTFADFCPWETPRHTNARLADDNAYLCGAVPPLVRKPIATLPSGRTVVGMGDVVVLNDPITGQGANNASAHAEVFYNMIREHGDKAFDHTWMQETFDRFWDYARWPTQFTNAMLSPLPEHAVELLGAAGQLPEVAHRFTNAFNTPEDLDEFFYDPSATRRYVEQARGRAGYAQLGRTHTTLVGAR